MVNGFMNQVEFRELLMQVRAGNEQAAGHLVGHFEPHLRRYVRLHLTDPFMRQVLDSMDICQSILGNFFIRAVAGQFELEHPGQLFRLLATMAQNKICDHARKLYREHQAGCQPDPGNDLAGQIAVQKDPCEQITGKDLLEKVIALMSDKERPILENRLQGDSWSEIASKTGENPTTLRKQFVRSMDRVARQLGLVEYSED